MWPLEYPVDRLQVLVFGDYADKTDSIVGYTVWIIASLIPSAGLWLGLKSKRNKISKYKGVEKTKNTWYARITVNGDKIYLGSFPTEKEAAMAYDTAASRHFGEFAQLNFEGSYGRDWIF